MPMRGCSSSASTSSSSSTTSKSIEIAGQPAHLHVIALPDDDDVVAHRGRGPRRRGARRARAGTWLRPRSARGRGSARGSAPDVPWAVTIRVGVLTCATSCATAMPLASRALRTVGLWTRSPRMVSGPASALLERQRDRVAHAEAHAQMRRSEDSHGVTAFVFVMYSILCDCKVYRPSRLVNSDTKLAID